LKNANSPATAPKTCCRKSFNIYKPQVQGVSLSTWGVVRRELCFQLPGLTKASQARQDRRVRKGKLNYAVNTETSDLEL